MWVVACERLVLAPAAACLLLVVFSILLLFWCGELSRIIHVCAGDVGVVHELEAAESRVR